MLEKSSFSYALIRLVPRVEREEFINVGVIVYCPARRFLKALMELDAARLAAVAPDLSVEEIEPHLEAIQVICRGGAEAGAIGSLSLSARFHWLTAPRSTVIQTSMVHTGMCDDPETVLSDLLNKMVRIRHAQSD
ncbi:MAG TPA: DUF3037 domain-containing protein [Blastocatellia bacterium]|nr:DUF3037 domain-containing protein [Blastocatellia bacterium]